MRIQTRFLSCCLITCLNTSPALHMNITILETATQIWITAVISSQIF